MVTEGGYPHREFKRGEPFSRQLRLSTRKQAPEPLTTVIGLKHRKGVLLFTDTLEATFHQNYYAKNPYQSKLHTINKYYAAACAGQSADIVKFTNALRDTFPDSKILPEAELYKKLNETMVTFVENQRREAKRMSGSPKFRFDCVCIFAAPLSIESSSPSNFSLYKIVIQIDPDSKFHEQSPFIERPPFYECAGSGGHIAKALLTLIEGLLYVRNGRYISLSKELAAMICHIVVLLTEKIDLGSADPIHNYNITKDGVKALWSADYWGKGDLLERFMVQLNTEVGTELGDLLTFLNKDRSFMEKLKRDSGHEQPSA